MKNVTEYYRHLILCSVIVLQSLSGNLHAVRANDQGPSSGQLPFLWKITMVSSTAERAAATAYLFGTIHVSEKSVNTFPPIAQQAWNESTAAWFEIDFQTSSGAQTKSISLPNGVDVADVIPADLLQQLDLRIKKISPLMSRSTLPNAKVAVWPLLLGNLDAQARHLGQLPMDLRLYQKARATGKKVGGLEEPTSQLELLDALTSEEQIAFLKATLDSMDDDDTNNIDRLQTTMDLYSSGDEEAFAKFIDDDFQRNGLPKELRHKIINGVLIRRNQLMADAILDNMKLNSGEVFFFAVGVGHLVGKDSVQNFLKQKSAVIERVGADAISSKLNTSKIYDPSR